VAAACHRSLERRSLGVCVWPAQRRSVAGVEAAPATVWDRAVLPRSLGRVCAAAGSGATLPWQTATVHASTSSARTENSHRPRPDPFALNPASLLRTGLSKGELFPGAACMPPRKLHRGGVLSTPLPSRGQRGYSLLVRVAIVNRGAVVDPTRLDLGKSCTARDVRKTGAYDVASCTRLQTPGERGPVARARPSGRPPRVTVSESSREPCAPRRRLAALLA
jgi:hypothetical protein